VLVARARSRELAPVLVGWQVHFDEQRHRRGFFNGVFTA
jgi:hypothetical protein